MTHIGGQEKGNEDTGGQPGTPLLTIARVGLARAKANVEGVKMGSSGYHATLADFWSVHELFCIGYGLGEAIRIVAMEGDHAERN